MILFLAMVIGFFFVALTPVAIIFGSTKMATVLLAMGLFSTVIIVREDKLAKIDSRKDEILPAKTDKKKSA